MVRRTPKSQRTVTLFPSTTLFRSTSQMFGELIGLWAADLWNRSGRPKAALVELGPGRGTLMADARRAAGRVPGMADLPVHLIETSPALRAEQLQRIPAAISPDDESNLTDEHAQNGKAACRETA